MNIKQKFESIDQSQLSEGQKGILDKIKVATKDFTINDQKSIEKVDSALDNIITKLKSSNPSAIKETKKAEPKATEKEKKSRTKTTKTTSKSKESKKPQTGKRTIMSVAKEIRKDNESWKDAMARAKKTMQDEREGATQKIKSETEKLLAFIKRRKELEGLSGTTIAKDSKVKAKPKGQRVVTNEGDTTNQYGTFSNKLGRKYYESRDNRSDRLAPNFKDKVYLADGGAILGVAETPLARGLGIDYTGLVGETGAMSSGEMFAKGGLVVTSINDIPNFEKNLEDGKITYRGLGMGKLSDDFFEKTGTSGTRIKVEGKEYFITDKEFNSFSRGADGKIRIKFDAPQRKGYADGGAILGVAETPLARGLGIDYTGLVGETGAMSSGEMFEQGGSLVDGYLTDPNFGDFQNTMFADGGYLKYQGTITNDAIESILKDDFPKANYQLDYNEINGQRVYGQVSILTEIKKHLSNEYGINSEYIKDGFGLPFLSIPNDVINKFADGGLTGLPDGTQQHFVNYYLGEGASQGIFAHGGSMDSKLEVGVYRVGKPIKVSTNLYEQKIVEVFDNGDIATASDYARTLSDFKSMQYPTISKEQLDSMYMYGGNFFKKGGRLLTQRERYIAELKGLTGIRQSAIDNFIDENNLTNDEILNIVIGLGRKQIQANNIATAIVGEKDNSEFKKLMTFVKSDKALREYKEGGRVVNIVNQDKEYSEGKYQGIFGDYDADGVSNINDLNPLDATKVGKVDDIEIDETFRKLIDLKNDLDSKMYEALEELDKKAPKNAEFYARTKTPFSIVKKLVDKRLLDPKKGLTDLIGTTVVVSNQQELEKVKKDLDNGLMGEVLDFDDFYENPNNGYRAYHYIVKFKGTPIEVQLKTKMQKQLNEVSHEFYKKGTLNPKGLNEVSEMIMKADKGDKKALEEVKILLSNEGELAEKISIESFAKGGRLKSALMRDRKYKNYSQDHEVRYSKDKINRKGYGFADGGNVIDAFQIRSVRGQGNSPTEILKTDQEVKFKKGGKILENSTYIPTYEVLKIYTKDGKVFENKYTETAVLSGIYVSEKPLRAKNPIDKNQIELFKKGGIPKSAIYIPRYNIDFIETEDNGKIEGNFIYGGVWVDMKKQFRLVEEAKEKGMFNRKNEISKFEAIYKDKKISIDAKSLSEAKTKAIAQLKVPKTKVGLLSVYNVKDPMALMYDNGGALSDADRDTLIYVNQILRRAVLRDDLTPEEANSPLAFEIAKEEVEEFIDDDMEEMGSSDFGYMYKYFLESYKSVKGESFAKGGSLDGVKLNFDFDTEGDVEFEYPQEVEKIKILKEKVDFDEVRGSVDYGKLEGNTDLKFYKNGKLVMSLKGDYNDKTDELITTIDILDSKNKINYHPYDALGGIDYSRLKKELDAINYKKDSDYNSGWLKYVKDNISYFDIDEEEDNFIMISSRENGNVGDEEHSIIDVREAKSILKKIKEKYPNTKGEIYTVDEFVYLELEAPKKFASGGSTTKRGGAMVLAKEIRKDGESWASALKRANAQIRKK